MPLDDLQKYFPGKEPAISAKDMNTLGEVVRMLRNISGPNLFVDSTGIYFRPGRQSPSLPKGKYQYQTFQMVSQNETGWDFDSLHAPVI